MASAVRGRRTPTEPHARWTRPEQSKQAGPVPPQQYLFPTCDHAKSTTAAVCRSFDVEDGKPEAREGTFVEHAEHKDIAARMTAKACARMLRMVTHRRTRREIYGERPDGLVKASQCGGLNRRARSSSRREPTVRRNRQDAGNRQGRQERRSFLGKISSLDAPGVLLASWRFLLTSMTVQGLGAK
jgi:hypothetical protein